jgi:hypothetical protein
MAGEEPKGEAPFTMDKIETAVGDQIKNLSGLLDGGMNVASNGIKSSTALVKDEVENMAGLAKVCLEGKNRSYLEFDHFIKELRPHAIVSFAELVS